MEVRITTEPTIYCVLSLEPTILASMNAIVNYG